MKKEGQSQTEYLVMVGTIAFAALILLYFGIQQIAQTHKISQAEEALVQLATKIDELSTLTKGSRSMVWIDVPPSSYELRLQGRRLSLVRPEPSGAAYVLTEETVSDLIGMVNLSGGLQQVSLLKYNETVVKLGTHPLLLQIQPSCVTTDASTKVVTLSGVDFSPLAKLYAVGLLPPLSSLFVDVETVTFDAGSLPGLGRYDLYLQNPDTTTTNTLCFGYHDSGEPCPCITGGGVG